MNAWQHPTPPWGYENFPISLKKSPTSRNPRFPRADAGP
jgi:hypothetical protein